ncbi:MAG: hypothetical protein NC240_02845 [Clostridium sp.]|nr:hypothetical protein [Clostridium sp.]
MSKKKTKKKKNKQNNVSSNKKIKTEEKNTRNPKTKKDDGKEIKSGKGKSETITKTKSGGNIEIEKANKDIKGTTSDKDTFKNDLNDKSDGSINQKKANNNNTDIKKAKKNSNSEKNTAKQAKISEIGENSNKTIIKTGNSNVENNDNKKIIKQGNKLIFSDDDTEPAGENTNTSGNNTFENKLELAVMSKKERRTAKRAAYREHTSTMSEKEKISYFFYCYKWHIIIPICCILLIACYGVAFYKNTRPTDLSYAVLNADEFDKTFHDDYLHYFNMPENHIVQATAGYYVNYDYYKENMVSAAEDGTNYSTLALTCESGAFDVIIGDDAGIKYCTFVEIVKPLDLYFTEEQYLALENYIVKFQDSSYTFYPYAVDISDTEFAKGLNLEYQKVYMAFPGVSEENMTNALRLLEYVLGIDLAK